MDGRQQGGTQAQTELLLAHCRAFDPRRPTAQERLEQALGAELAHMLVFALAPGRPRERRAA